MFYLKERFIAWLIVGALGTFIVSGYLSCEEFQYMTKGRRTQATIDSVSSGVDGKTVSYHYRPVPDDIRRSKVEVPASLNIPREGKFELEFLDDASRPVGVRNIGSLVIFFGSLAAMLAGGVLFWMHVQRAIRPTSRSGSGGRRK